MNHDRQSTLAVISVVAWVTAAAMSQFVGMWSAVGGAAIVLGLAILFFGRPSTTALMRVTPQFFVLGIIAGVAMTAVTHLLYPVFASIFPLIVTDTASLYAAFHAPSLAVVSVVLLPIIIGEELVWRGVVQASLVERLGVWRGVILAAAVYAFVHVPLGAPVLVAAAFGCGIAWGTLRAVTQSLVPTLIAHILWDLLVLLWWPLQPA